MALTRKDQFRCTGQGQHTFDRLTALLLVASVLQLPDPEEPFRMEPFAPPCVYFLHHLIPTKCKYLVGEKELFLIKFAKKMAKHLCVGSTDHKILASIQQAKWLNLLSFSCFKFTVCYRVSTSNGKLDT